MLVSENMVHGKALPVAAQPVKIRKGKFISFLQKVPWTGHDPEDNSWSLWKWKNEQKSDSKRL